MGSHPEATLTLDGQGNLYGTAQGGGLDGAGTVFKLSHSRSGWSIAPLCPFHNLEDPSWPSGTLMVATDNSLLGIANYAEGGGCCGRVFHLRPPPNPPRSIVDVWNETSIHTFTGDPDGDTPAGSLTHDGVGAIYLTTALGGQFNAGAVVKLTPTEGGWIETNLYNFAGHPDGANPMGGVIFDNAGNLYGTTQNGGTYGWGTIFQLSPSGSGWTESVLFNFQGESDGANPVAGLVLDGSGNLYGSTDPCYLPGQLGSSAPCSTVFELSPSGSTWTLTTLYAWDDRGVQSSLVRDAAGNLYGTTLFNGAYDAGSVFKLTPTSGGWTYTSLHDFTGGADGAYPFGGPILNASNNLYGTTWSGGPYGYYGVVWEITP